MTPNPLVAMAAPAPETRYAPREMPRAGSRKEGPSFEERLNLASAKSKPGSTSKGVAESKSQGKPEAKAEASTETSPKEAGKVEEQAKTPEANLAAEVVAPAVPVSELSSVAVMTAAPAPQTPAPEVPEEGLAPQAVVQAAVAEGTEVADPALTAVVAKALEPQAKPVTAAKADAAAKPAEEAEAAEPAEPEVTEVAKAPVSVKPIARQSVPSSLDGLRAEKGLMSLRESLDGAPRTETAPAPAKNESRPMPAHLDEVKATVVDEAAPQASTVKPWEITEPVRVVTDGTAIKSDSTLKAEPVPVKEAITRTFVQVHKTPDRPAELRLQLNPEHLGRMEVRVHAHEGAVSAVIRVEHAGVRDMVENQLAALRTSLAEQGIKVDRLEVSVNQQGPRDQQAAAGFEFGRQSFGQDGQRESSGQANQGQAHRSGWDAWSLEESDEVPVPETESGFDAQA
ncbi:Flagellar hook-length control protein FliK [compost metagenome]